MPRNISDVLDHLLPEAERSKPVEPESANASAASQATGSPRTTASASRLLILGLPISHSDVVRAAFAWNLVVEVARLGGHAVLVSPSHDTEASLWPDHGLGPLGAEVVLAEAEDLGALERAVLDVAETRAAEAEEAGIVFARVPPLWLRKAADGPKLLQHSLLFTSTEPRDLLETYGIAKLLLGSHIGGRIGVTVHGVQRLEEASEAFLHLSEVAERRLGRSLESYGALVDDLHVYRAIVARRPIGLAHPQSAAAHSLRDVAEILLRTAKEEMRG